MHPKIIKKLTNGPRAFAPSIISDWRQTWRNFQTFVLSKYICIDYIMAPLKKNFMQYNQRNKVYFKYMHIVNSNGTIIQVGINYCASLENQLANAIGVRESRQFNLNER